MIRYRVTVIERHPDGTDWADIFNDFETRADAGRFAAEARLENPNSVVDVVAINERGEIIPDRHTPARTAASDAAKNAVMALGLQLGIRHISELDG